MPSFLPPNCVVTERYDDGPSAVVPCHPGNTTSHEAVPPKHNLGHASPLSFSPVLACFPPPLFPAPSLRPSAAPSRPVPRLKLPCEIFEAAGETFEPPGRVFGPPSCFAVRVVTRTLPPSSGTTLHSIPSPSCRLMTCIVETHAGVSIVLRKSSTIQGFRLRV